MFSVSGASHFPHQPDEEWSSEMHDPTLTFTEQEAWEGWLEANGATVTGVWLRIAKRSAEQPTVSYAQALESALCYGWIDGQ